MAVGFFSGQCGVGQKERMECGCGHGRISKGMAGKLSSLPSNGLKLAGSPVKCVYRWQKLIPVNSNL